MFTSSLINRTVIGVLIPFLLVVGIVFFQTSGLLRELKGKSLSELRTTLRHLEHELGYRLTVTGQLAHIMASSDAIVTAFEEHQNDRLYHTGLRMIDAGMVSRVRFLNDQGIVLARSHDEFRFNDLFEDAAVIKTAASGAAFSGMIREENRWFFRA